MEYAEICKDIIIGHAELERQRANLIALNLNPISAVLLYHRFLSYNNNDTGDLKKSQLAYFYIERLRAEIETLINNAEEPRFFVISIRR